MKTRLHDIKLFDLDSQTVLQFSKFVHRARTGDGVEIRLNDPQVVRKVVLHGIVSEDPVLKTLLRRIAQSLRTKYQLDLTQDINHRSAMLNRQQGESPQLLSASKL